MTQYLLILSESEGIVIAAAHLPRPGDVIDVVKDYGDRPRFRFTVSHVEFEAVVEDVPNSAGVRGHTDTLPMVHGRITSRRVKTGVWEPTRVACKHGVAHNIEEVQHACDGCCRLPNARPDRWPGA